MDEVTIASTNSEESVDAPTDLPPEVGVVESEPPDGELKILRESLEIDHGDDLDKPFAETIQRQSSKVDDEGESRYGEPLSVEVAAERMPPGIGGLTYMATLIPDEFFDGGKLAEKIPKRVLNVESTAIKPRRATPAVRSSNFFNSLTKVGPRYIFSGVLNGWPGLTCLEVLSLERKGKLVGVWHKEWTEKEHGSKGRPLERSKPNKIYRVGLQAAPWSSLGWSQESPGFVFWYESQHLEGPRISYGTQMVQTVGSSSVCTYIHMVSHRYARLHESPKDLLTYHSVCLLEWDHGEYTTVVETAFLNGIGGYLGRSNWYHDRDQPLTQLYQTMKPEMILPWRENMAEIRCYDVEAKNLVEFEDYMKQYGGNRQRFIDPKISFSHPARLTFRSKSHIAQYLVNYISRDATYAELRRNCQTFAADLCSFVAGKKDIAPFHPVIRIDYQPRTHLFLYDSHLYAKKSEQRRGKKK